MTHPGERVQADVKVVPCRCIADLELPLFQYTAIDEFTRLRFLAAYPGRPEQRGDFGYLRKPIGLPVRGWE